MTLFELMAVLAIMSIIAVAGTPFFINLMRDSDVHSAPIDFIKDLHKNKQEAINQSTSLYMYPINMTDDFQGGWENYNNGVVTAREVPATVLISANTDIFGFKFSSNGKIYDAVTEIPLVEQTYTFCYSGDSSVQGRMVTINALGKTTVQYVGC